MKETCQNCKHKKGCLLREVTIFNLFVATGRGDMVQEAREKMNIRPNCGDQWEDIKDKP